MLLSPSIYVQQIKYLLEILVLLLVIIFISNVIKDRSKEFEGISHILSSFNNDNIISLPSNTSIEGGDVIVHDDYIFVGVSSEEDFNSKKC